MPVISPFSSFTKKAFLMAYLAALAFIIVGLSPVYSVNSGIKLTDMKVFYGKKLKSIEFRSTVTSKDGVTSFYNTRRYILSYDSNSRSYYLKE